MRYVTIISLFLACLVLGCGGPAKKVAKKTKVPTAAAKKAPAKKTKVQPKQPGTGSVASSPAEGTPFLRPDQLEPGTTVDPAAEKGSSPTAVPKSTPATTPIQSDFDPLALVVKTDTLVVRVDAPFVEHPLVRALSGDGMPLEFLVPPDLECQTVWLYVTPSDEFPLFATCQIFASAAQRDKSLAADPQVVRETAEFEGKKYMKTKTESGVTAYCLLGERSVFSGSEARVKEVLAAKGPPGSKIVAAMKLVQEKGQIAAAAVLSDRRLLTETQLQELGLPPQLDQFLKGVDVGAVAIDLRGAKLLELNLTAAGGQNDELQKNAKALLEVVGTLVGNAKVELGDEPNSAANKSMLALAEKLLGTATLDKQGEFVRLTLPKSAELDKLPEMLAAGKKESEDAGKAKYPSYIAQALIQDGAFPIKDFLGKDGKAKKPLLSWRVMALWGLEQSPLFDQFNLDEPWDSEQNKKVIEKMPAVFETPLAPEKGTTTWKLLPDRNGGVVIVEGGPGSAVPWTKPDQVEFDPEKPLAQFGEEPPGGYRVVLSTSWDPVRLSAAELKAKLKAVMKHGAKVLAIDPEGKLLVSGGLDNHIKLWDLSIGKELADWDGHTDFIEALAFNKDSKLVASGSSDKKIRIWDVVTRKHKATLEGHESDVKGVVFFPDGKRLASAGRDNTVRIWNLETGKNIDTLKCKESMYAVALSPDSRYLAAAGLDGALMLWDLKKEGAATQLMGHKENVYCVAFSPDGKSLYSGGIEGIKVWKTADGSAQGTIGAIKDVETLAFDRSGMILLSGEDHIERGVKLWDVATGTQVAAFKYGDSAAVIHPDGKMVYTMVNSIIQPWTMEEKVAEEEK